MSLLHVFETRKPHPGIKHIHCGYTIKITFCVINDDIDIHVASVKPDGSALTHQISPQMFPKLAEHYARDLRQISCDDIYQQTIIQQRSRA